VLSSGMAIAPTPTPMSARGRNPLLGLLPHRGTITVEVVAAGSTPEETETLIEADLATLRAELGRYVISEDERDLPQVVADLLIERGLTIATVEVGTGGLVAARLTEPEGSQRWFRRSAVPDMALALLGKPRGGSMADEEAALTMASTARHATGADIAVTLAKHRQFYTIDRFDHRKIRNRKRYDEERKQDYQDHSRCDPFTVQKRRICDLIHLRCDHLCQIINHHILNPAVIIRGFQGLIQSGICGTYGCADAIAPSACKHYKQDRDRRHSHNSKQDRAHRGCRNLHADH